MILNILEVNMNFIEIKITCQVNICNCHLHGKLPVLNP